MTTKDRIKADEFLRLESSRKINELLLLPSSTARGCWIANAKTVYGDVRIGNKQWATYTVPIFAYLRHVDSIVVPRNGEIEKVVEIKKGFTNSFSSEMTGTYSVKLGIEQANTNSELTTGFSASEAWSRESTQKESVKIKDEKDGTVVHIYQTVFVYANLATQAARECEQFFTLSRAISRRDPEQSPDLLYLSSIYTSATTYKHPESSITPLKWDDIQDMVLSNYDPVEGGCKGVFFIDPNAYHYD